MTAVTAPILLAGCGAEPPLSRVHQILAQCDSYLGKPVRVAGFLGDCAGYSCYLFDDKAALGAFQSAWNQHAQAERKFRRDGEKPEDRKLAIAAFDRVNAVWPIGIGGEAAFDRKAAPHQNSYVVITGRVEKDSCDGRGGMDRFSGIEPTDIRAWTPSEGAPANTQ